MQFVATPNGLIPNIFSPFEGRDMMPLCLEPVDSLKSYADLINPMTTVRMWSMGHLM